MADGLVNLSDQFQGLPMDSLIGGPLTAAAKAEIMLANETVDFINKVGFYWTKDAQGNLIPTTRYVDFDFDRQNQNKDGNPVTETVTLHVPLLSIVPVPNLQVDTVDIIFDMEVKSATSSKTSNDQEIGFDVKIGLQAGPFTLNAEIQGKISAHQENTRSSDNSAKYHVDVHASNHGMPEGLARVWDIMAASISPVTKSNAPTVTNVNPNSGAAAGGTPVTITGTGFKGATGVNFGSKAAMGFTVTPTSAQIPEGTQITVNSPVGSQGVVNVTVITPGGTSATSSNSQFTYN